MITLFDESFLRNSVCQKMHEIPPHRRRHREYRRCEFVKTEPSGRANFPAEPRLSSSVTHRPSSDAVRRPERSVSASRSARRFIGPIRIKERLKNAAVIQVNKSALRIMKAIPARCGFNERACTLVSLAFMEGKIRLNLPVI